MNKNSLNYIFVLLVLLTSLMSCSTKKTENEKNETFLGFKKNARVVFVGNSITHMGMFHNNIQLYYLTRFPNKNIQIYNCGVSGDVTWGVLDRMEEDILIHKPTNAVMMLGMNDVGREWYGTTPTNDIDTLNHRKKLLQDYRQNMDKIVHVFLEKNIDIILERPSIYDQTAILPEKNHFGVNDELAVYAISCDSLAKKYNLHTVDYFGIMNNINTEMQKKDSSFTLTGQDRIHPGETGHFVMTYEFLKSDKAPKYVSQIILNKVDNSADKSVNCEVQNISTNNGVSFTVLENALPFPVKENQKEALQLVPFMNEFNVELLQVNQLIPETKYQLKIDDEIIGDFTGKQLAKGINLAEYPNTPQYKQSLEVLKTLQQLWQIEGKLRGMKFVEYLPQYKKIPDTKNLDVIEAFMDSAFVADGYTDPYYKSELNKFIKNKPKEEEYKKECEVLRKKAYEEAQPTAHKFSLKSDF